MIITKTPLRISLAGGGSDLPAYYEKHAGGVVSFAINKYIYICLKDSFDNKVRVSYSRTENVETSQDVEHDLVRACMEIMGIKDNIEMVSMADIPGKGSGLGSSSSFTAGLLLALREHLLLRDPAYVIPYQSRGHNSTGFPTTRRWLAESASRLEIEYLNKPVGKQDQYAAAYGGLNYIHFGALGSVEVHPIESDSAKQGLEKHLMLFWTGISRNSSDILADQNDKTLNLEGTRGLLTGMVDASRTIRRRLEQGVFDDIGEMMHNNWVLKRRLSDKISNPEISGWYDRALEAGAIGGKVCGAGGGGFMVFFVPPDKQWAVEEALPLRHVPFKIEERGSHVAYMTGFNDG